MITYEEHQAMIIMNAKEAEAIVARVEIFGSGLLHGRSWAVALATAWGMETKR